MTSSWVVVPERSQTEADLGGGGEGGRPPPLIAGDNFFFFLIRTKTTSFWS